MLFHALILCVSKALSGRYTAWQAAEKLGVSVEQFRKLAKKQGLKPIAVESRANNIWGVAYYRAGEIENLRPHLSSLSTSDKRKVSTKHLTLWESLSVKQQKLLLAVYYEDQINEVNAQARARSNFHAPQSLRVALGTVCAFSATTTFPTSAATA